MTQNIPAGFNPEELIKENESLKLENAKVSQKVSELKQALLQLQMIQQPQVQQQEKNQVQTNDKNFQKKYRDLQDKFRKSELQRYQELMEQKQQILDVTKKYDTQLRDLRACLGFTLG